MKKNRLVLSLLALFLILASGLTIYWFIAGTTDKSPFHRPCHFVVKEEAGRKIVLSKCKLTMLYGFLPDKTVYDPVSEKVEKWVLENSQQ